MNHHPVQPLDKFRRCAIVIDVMKIPENRMPSLELTVRPSPEQLAVLSPAALAFVAELSQQFAPRVSELLARRSARKERLARGEKLGFLRETASVRSANWQVAALPGELHDRRVEITGPVERKMIINALNSGANVFMADFEDATTPTFDNLVNGQQNLFEAVRRTLRLTAPDTGRSYTIVEKPAVLMVRPRGWHLPEAHVRLADTEPIPGALFDFGLYLFHNARQLLDRGSGPYFYLPKMESHLEARLWNEVFLFSEAALRIPQGSIKATCLIETLPAAFEMDEILHELREHSAGLNCGRWDYIFSYIKTLGADLAKVLPDRAQITMDRGFLRTYTRLLIETCHRRGAQAMGGMAAQIPIKDDPKANALALEKVRADKRREVDDGHDGTWVAHPALVPVARAIFDQPPKSDERAGRREEVGIPEAELPALEEDLLRPIPGTITGEGLRHNIRVGIQYIEAWLRGQGCVPLYNLMEDAATAEICRTQVWQWLRHHAVIRDGETSEPLTPDRFRSALKEEMGRFANELGEAPFVDPTRRFPQARALFEKLVLSPQCEEFLTLPAYRELVAAEEPRR
jgi:malate synthase